MWGNTVELERKRRIKLCVWAYAYEIRNDPLVDDSTFDCECLAVDVSVLTGNDDLDMFFICEFQADTGMWIHKHPDLAGVEYLYTKIKQGK